MELIKPLAELVWSRILGERKRFLQEHGFPCCSAQLSPWSLLSVVSQADDKKYVSATVVPPRLAATALA